jgi:hypothetical protein
MSMENEPSNNEASSGTSVLSAGFGGGATPAPMDPGVLVVRTTSGAEFIFDAGTHSYEVWVSDKKRWRKVEITLYTDKGSWIVKTIDFPVSIERRFSTPNEPSSPAGAASCASPRGATS